MKRRRGLIIGTATVVIAGLALLVLTGNIRHTITLSAAQIQSALQSKFPIEKKPLIFTVKFSDPTTAIDPTSGQVTVGLKCSMAALGRKAANGDGTATGTVRYEPKTGELFLDNPKVKLNSLELIGLAQRDKGKATDLIEAGLQECFKRTPIYKLDDKDSQMLMVHRIMKSMRVENGELKIELGL